MIVKPGRSIAIYDFDDVLDYTGSVVTTGVTRVAPAPVTATITAQNTITLAAHPADPFSAGEEIVISGIDDPRTSRLIDSVFGLKLILSEQFDIYDDAFPVAITVARTKNLLKTTTDLKEGKYRLSPSNALLVVRNSFNNPYIATDDLQPFDNDSAAMSDGDLIRLNAAALQKVYKDLAAQEGIYDAIWFDDIRVLKIYAMVMIRSGSTSTEWATAKRNDYYQELENVKKRYAVYEDSLLNGGAPVDGEIVKVRQRWSF